MSIIFKDSACFIIDPSKMCTCCPGAEERLTPLGTLERLFLFVQISSTTLAIVMYDNNMLATIRRLEGDQIN